MAQVNPLTRELLVKLVYYGPGLGGKTTSLQCIHQSSPPETRGQIVSLATPVDRTLYFDFLPLRATSVRSHHVRLQLFTVPGQVYFNATRKLVLTGVDGVVFVADSQRGRHDANLESLENLADNLESQGRDIAAIPMVLQYNKRDLPGVMPVEEMDASLNVHEVPSFATCASEGEGVLAALDSLVQLVIEDLEARNALGAPSKPRSEHEFSRAEGTLAERIGRATLSGWEDEEEDEEAGTSSEGPEDSAVEPADSEVVDVDVDDDDVEDVAVGPEAGVASAAETELEADPRREIVARPTSAPPPMPAPPKSPNESAGGDEASEPSDDDPSGATADDGDAHTEGGEAPRAGAGTGEGAPSLFAPEGPAGASVQPSAIPRWREPGGLDEPGSVVSKLPLAPTPPPPPRPPRPPAPPGPPIRPSSMPGEAGGPSWAPLFGEDAPLILRIEMDIARGEHADAVTRLDGLARRMLEQLGRAAGYADDGMHPASVASFLGVDPARWIELRRLARRARASGQVSLRDVLEVYSVVIELRSRRDHLSAG